MAENIDCTRTKPLNAAAQRGLECLARNSAGEGLNDSSDEIRRVQHDIIFIIGVENGRSGRKGCSCVSVLIPDVSFRIQRVSVLILDNSHLSCQRPVTASNGRPTAFQSRHEPSTICGTDNINEKEYARFVSSNPSVPRSLLTTTLRTDTALGGEASGS